MMGQRARSERLGHTRVGVQHAAKTWGTAYGQPRNALGGEQDAGSSALTTQQRRERGPKRTAHTAAHAPDGPPPHA
jgi:hypothetical protein